MDFTKDDPKPGIPNIFSITKLPTSKLDTRVPNTETIGSMAFLTACFNITTDLLIPLDWAVLM